ncbi:anion transporter [Bifidobacterium pullorum subsp. saeculare]|uniref:Anion transporter n=1 Tax=Bifidobacterium pullorum subsp. saeculare TaxID=78257 RepID=A0A938WY49_9BIFI|nr:SLC13 family permease [Bifidobacterium pullorum]MBM6698802.1 anion transporter [Bifidobacterium pullorum subsp. saeculare]
MRQLLVKLAKNETILIVAAVLALVSCFIVPPDAQYADYIHASTILQLVCLMLVVCGLQRIGVFRIIGSRLLHHVNTERGLVVTLVALTYFSAMLITNDVALVTFVPFAIAVLMMADMEDRAVLVGALMAIAANVGSMLTPIGNAHNLYLKALTGMPSGEMIGIMAPYSLTAALLLLVVIFVAFGRKPVDELRSLDGAGLETGVLAPDSSKPRPDEIRITGYGAGYGGWRTIVYAALFVVCLLAVSDIIPLWAMCVVVVAAFLVTDRRAFRHVDWGLPLTFCMFFIFIGNMKRVPAFYELAASLVDAHPLEVAVGSSQLISNVPSTLLLSGFCDQWRELIIGTNLGGMGTLIASMASLVAYKNVTRRYPDRKGWYLAVYTAMNVLFLAVLLTLSWIIE